MVSLYSQDKINEASIALLCQLCWPPTSSPLSFLHIKLVLLPSSLPLLQSLCLIICQGHLSCSPFTWLTSPYSSGLSKVTFSFKSLSRPGSLPCVVVHCITNVLYHFTHLASLKFLVEWFCFPRMSSMRAGTRPVLLTILCHGFAQCSAHSKCSSGSNCQVAKRGTKWMRREGRHWFVCRREREPLCW